METNKILKNATPQMSTILGELLEVCIHQLLYSRNIYPHDVFTPTRYLDIRCQACRHVDVVSYISEFLVVASPSLVHGDATDIVLLIINGYTEEVLERYCFHVDIQKHFKENEEEDSVFKYVKEMEWMLRQFVLKIITLEQVISNKSMNHDKMLPDSVTFKLCLRTKIEPMEAVHNNINDFSNDNEERPKFCKELNQAISDGLWFQPDEDSCIFMSENNTRVQEVESQNHSLSQNTSNASSVLTRPIKTLNIPSCGLKMSLVMEVMNH